MASEWNDPADIALVSETFKAWTDAVLARDKATVESFHDDGFRVRMGERILTKDEHVTLELAVASTQMDLVSVEATRRVGDLLLVWSRHFIKVDSIPELPALGLVGDWANEAVARRGFTQDEMTVWRFEGGRIRCLAFDIGGFVPSSDTDQPA